MKLSNMFLFKINKIQLLDKMDQLQQLQNDGLTSMIQEIYTHLESVGENNADNLIVWMKGTDVVTSENEARVRSIIRREAADTQNVTFPEFQGVIRSVAAEQGITPAQLMNKLVLGKRRETLTGAISSLFPPVSSSTSMTRRQ